jgi:hypothetical protein
VRHHPQVALTHRGKDRRDILFLQIFLHYGFAHLG